MMVRVFAYALAFSIVIPCSRGDFQRWISSKTQRAPGASFTEDVNNWSHDLAFTETLRDASVDEDVSNLIYDLAFTETPRDEHHPTCPISMQPSSTAPSVNAGVSQKGFPFFNGSKIQVRNKRDDSEGQAHIRDQPLAKHSFSNDVFELLEKDGGVSKECKIEVKQLLNKYDLRGIYASGTGEARADGIKDGISFLGNFTQCFEEKVGETLTIRKYCLVRLHLPKEKNRDKSAVGVADGYVKQGLGVCVPVSCTKKDVNISVNGFLNRLTKYSLNLTNKDSLNLTNEDSLNVTNKVILSITCQTNEKRHYDNAAIWMICAVALHIILLACGTFYGCFRKLDEKIRVLTSGDSVPHRRHSMILRPSTSDDCPSADPSGDGPPADLRDDGRPVDPSLYMPLWKDILLSYSTKHCFLEFAHRNHPDDWLGYLDGLKVLGTIIIIFSHTFSYAAMNLYREPGSLNTDDEDFRWYFMAFATITVDGFYFVSGIIICYATRKRFEADRRRGKCHFGNRVCLWICFVLRMYCRLMPLLLILIAISATLLHYINCGPNYIDCINMYNSRCRKHWHVNLIPPLTFLWQNEEMCFPPSWYIAGDMLFATAAYAVVWALYAHQILGFIILSLTSVVCTCVTILLSMAEKNFPVEPVVFSDSLSETTKASVTPSYMMPYTHAAPYAIGMWIGHCISKNINNTQETSWWRTLQLHSLSICSIVLALIYLTYTLSAQSTAMTWAVFFRALFYPFTVVILEIIISSGHFRRPQMFRNLRFSWRWFRYPSRLTYAAYLIHPVTMSVYYGCEIADYYSASMLVLHFIMHVFLTYLLAFVFVVFVEFPIRNASKTFINYVRVSRMYPLRSIRNVLEYFFPFHYFLFNCLT